MSVIALRLAHKSVNPTAVIIPAIIATGVSTIAGLTLDGIIRRKNANK